MAFDVGSIFGGLASAGLGGITGLLGTGISAFMDYKKQKIQNEHEQKMHALELQMMTKEAELAIRKTDAEADAQVRQTAAVTEQKVAEQEAEAFKLSAAQAERPLLAKKFQDSRFTIYTFTIVDAIRSAIRPVLTIIGTIMIIVIYFKVDDYVGGLTAENAFSKIELFELYRYLVYSFVYLTFTMVFWWFGTRSKVKPPAQPNESLLSR
ncbi:MAG: hypothetical protein HKP58_09640 [Desulfatitalea sp.]|nr:hypothetical protein [Desulfatitalea sp.]NNK00663.1 hypothetical protein [Desulfatitalea sp.]